MTDTTTLAPCPFCGDRAVSIVDDLLTFYVQCETCGTSGGPSSYRNGAVSGWNRRAPAPASGEDVSPFGYFRAEPFGWTDCAESDEGAKPLYEKPQAQEARVPLLPNQRGLIALTADSISDAIDMTEFAHGITAAQKETPCAPTPSL